MKVDAEHVAALLSDPSYFDKPQKILAGLLGISEVLFSRYKAEAIDRDLLKPVPPRLNIKSHSVKQRVKTEINQLIGGSTLEKQLKKLSDNTLQRVLVFGDEEKTTQDNYKALSEGAARYLTGIIAEKSTRYTGVAWGETVSSVIHEIARIQKGHGSRFSSKNKHFVPVCGDSRIALNDTSQRGSKLIKLLYQAYTGSEDNQYSHSVAASIPGNFNPKELKVIREFLMHVGDFSNVFELDESHNLRLTVNLDLLITSCGTNSNESNNWLDECATREGISPTELEKITVGNLSGYWLGKAKLSKKDRGVLDDINARWNGIRYQDFKELFTRRAIALVAGSPEKSDIVLHLVSTKRLISHLLISADLAKAIETKLCENRS